VLAAVGWETVGAMVAVMAPLVGVPLTMITFYLRGIHEQQSTRQADTDRRFERVEQSVRQVSEAIDDFEREYTTKEEWLRESMHARQQLERLLEMIARVQAELENSHGLAAEFARATRAMVALAEQLSGQGSVKATESPSGERP